MSSSSIRPLWLCCEGGVGTSGSERCHLQEDQTQDALDRPVVEKTATSLEIQRATFQQDKRVSQDGLRTVTTLPRSIPIYVSHHLGLNPTTLNELEARIKTWGEKKQNPKGLKEFVIRFDGVPQNQRDVQVAELAVSHTTVWRVSRKRLQLKPYRYQIVQALKPTDKPLRKKFCEKFQEKFDVNGFENTLVFTDEVFCGKVNRHNLRFWGTENVYVTLEHQRDSPKMNVFCALSNSCVFGPFFFAENSINGDIYQDMLSEWLLPQLEESIPDFILQQNSALQHWNKNVLEFLNEHLLHRWIGHAGPKGLGGTEAADNCSVELHHREYSTMSVTAALLPSRHLSCHRRGTY
ncbi:DUF4817 domain-containing protein [Trichonephila clavipes]|uniref:DUF4817 domain-containing protein n=1 Tax=Trichonephila clavipes TaxID=2585209 RepID=A0A8X6R6I5_TRICX|nr:DUF4817 domain-containing protein [Trichonephila clavipes]